MQWANILDVKARGSEFSVSIKRLGMTTRVCNCLTRQQRQAELGGQLAWPKQKASGSVRIPVLNKLENNRIRLPVPFPGLCMCMHEYACMHASTKTYTQRDLYAPPTPVRIAYITGQICVPSAAELPSQHVFRSLLLSLLYPPNLTNGYKSSNCLRWGCTNQMRQCI